MAKSGDVLLFGGPSCGISGLLSVICFSLNSQYSILNTNISVTLKLLHLYRSSVLFVQ